MDKFLDLVRESVIVQGLITLAFVTTVCYLFASGQPVSEELITFLGVVLGFYFGSKVQQYINRY